MVRGKQKTLFVNHLLEAVKFVSHTQSGKGDEATTHAAIRYGTILASDRTLAAGCPIAEDDLDCCPQTERLRLALERCGPEHSIVQQEQAVFIRSGEFSGYVPLCNPALVPIPVPDANCAPLGDTFRAALKVCASLVKESAPTVLQSAIQLNPTSCVSTNGNVILEAWHGFDMPPGLLIPVGFAKAICAIRKPLVGFGFSDQTMTVHFDDRSWLRAALYTEKVPEIASKIRPVTKMYPMPKEFFQYVDSLSKWSEDGRVYLNDFRISSHPPDKQSTGSELSYESVEFLQETSYSIADLKLISKYATGFEDREHENVTMFFGDRLRGAIAHRRTEKPKMIVGCGGTVGICDGLCNGSCIQ